ncbi:MAG: glycosyltransferase family A protein [Ignavibacteria bacterium]|nr:glycosyltransferase family A protein [Ignavibacteria bacterium]
MNPVLPDNVQKYLSRYGSVKWRLEAKGNLKYDVAIVVPAIAEYKNIITLLNSLAENVFNKNYEVLIIFVINNIISSSDEVKEENHKTLKLLKAIINDSSSYHPVIHKFNSSGLSIGFIDASSESLELPEKTGGVGLARKIGMDISLRVFDYSKAGKKILICLDADCTVEKNYIEEIVNHFNAFNINAGVINYEHPLPDDDENIKAIISYEIFLGYYELGLKYAGSQYAFQTVGSAMACDYEAYIKIEGMNKRKAAEDFYFLEKLAKHYKIKKINSTKVFPSARQSWRVPFGTGQRMNRFHSKSQNEYLLYDPESFNILKEWLKLFNSEKNFTGEDYLKEVNKINSELCNFLSEQNFKKDWNNIISNSRDDRHLNIQKQRWFDGFRILKLIHHLRDNAYPLINMFGALDILFKYSNLTTIKERDNDIPCISIQKKYLQTLRNFLNHDN